MNAAFDKLDTNHDGYLTKAEAQSQVPDFAKADINKDGHLSQTEFASAQQTASTTKKSSSGSNSSSWSCELPCTHLPGRRTSNFFVRPPGSSLFECCARHYTNNALYGAHGVWDAAWV